MTDQQSNMPEQDMKGKFFTTYVLYKHEDLGIGQVTFKMTLSYFLYLWKCYFLSKFFNVPLYKEIFMHESDIGIPPQFKNRWMSVTILELRLRRGFKYWHRKDSDAKAG